MSYDKNYILLNSNIGIEFEFFSRLPIEDTQKNLSKLLEKRIKIETKAHSEFTPDYDHFKMEPDMSGGSNLIELITGPLPYLEAKLIIGKVLGWIKRNGSTNDRCSIHLNISFNGKKLGPNFNLSKLNVGKFILNFDEDKIYDKFPARKNSVYAKSIKFIAPLNYFQIGTADKLSPRNYTFVKNKYYGINFSKLPKEYLEFRYLGGENYQYLLSEILELADYFILSLAECLINPALTKSNVEELDNIIEIHNKYLKGFKNLENFRKIFPDIKLTVDLQTHDQIIASYFSGFRNKLFEIITKTEMKEGKINYDSDLGRIQIKDADLHSFEVTGIDIVECNIRGTVNGCDIFNSNIINATLISCNLFKGSIAKGCMLNNCYINNSCDLEDSYVYGQLTVFSGEMKGGIFRQGRITKHAKFDNTELVEYEKID